EQRRAKRNRDVQQERHRKEQEDHEGARRPVHLGQCTSLERHRSPLGQGPIIGIMLTSRMAWNALVLGGGGAKGEFEVGILEHLAQKQFNFDFFTGVSVGALNVSVLAQYQSLADAVPALEKLWLEIRSNDDVYTQPLLGKPLALWDKRESVFNSDPLQRRIASHVQWSR